ncbi:MAG: ATP-grasp domain-containing protein [Gammaproteobacteria bacterium]|nr:MAG: ATP-grasp domain-containing protein [Gammaproteobacteria bacterium]
MKNKARFVFLESNTTGTGELLILKALTKNLFPIFITNNPKKYSFLPLEEVELILLDTSNKEIILDYLLKVENIIGIYSASDYYIETAAWLANKLELPGADPEVIKRCRNKYNLYQLLISVGIDCPQTKIIFDIEEAKNNFEFASFPVIVKPVNGSGSVGVKLCENETDSLSQVNFLLKNSYAGVLIQEYIDGLEFSVEVCSFNNQHHIIGITKKYLGLYPYFIEIGHDFPAILLEKEEKKIKQVIMNLLSLLRCNFGFFHIELRIKNDKVFIIEINPRLAGGMIPALVRNATEIDLLDTLLDLYTNRFADIQISHKKFSSIRYLVPDQTGKIKTLNFTSQILVDQVKLIKNEGDFFIPHGDFRDRIAYVIVSDLDAISCSKKANEALKDFNVVIGTES